LKIKKQLSDMDGKFGDFTKQYLAKKQYHLD